MGFFHLQRESQDSTRPARGPPSYNSIGYNAHRVGTDSTLVGLDYKEVSSTRSLAEPGYTPKLSDTEKDAGPLEGKAAHSRSGLWARGKRVIERLSSGRLRPKLRRCAISFRYTSPFNSKLGRLDTEETLCDGGTLNSPQKTSLKSVLMSERFPFRKRFIRFLSSRKLHTTRCACSLALIFDLISKNTSSNNETEYLDEDFAQYGIFVPNVLAYKMTPSTRNAFPSINEDAETQVVYTQPVFLHTMKPLLRRYLFPFVNSGSGKCSTILQVAEICKAGNQDVSVVSCGVTVTILSFCP
jgi:hypothetical protein